MDDKYQYLFNIIAVLAEMLGGEVVISEHDMVTGREGLIIKNSDGSITIKVGK